MESSKIKFGEIIADLYYNPLKNNKAIIIFCPGIPGRISYDSFAEKFVSKGFVFLHPKYMGSWESGGIFSIENCKKTIEIVLSKIKGGIRNISGNKINLAFEKIFLMGHSFGGSLALVLGSEKDVNGIISLAPIINYRSHGTNKNIPEENLEELFGYLAGPLKKEFRGLSKEDWLDFCKNGKNLNPIDFLDSLKNKNIFLAHGKLDKSVNFLKTKNFYSKLGNKKVSEYFECPKAGHSDIREKSAEKIISWILNLE